MELNLKATTTIPTERAERLAKQFISHWGRHADEVERDGDDRTTMRFPAGDWAASTVLVETTPNALGVTIRTSDEDDLAKNCDSIAEHLHRFAGRNETLTIEWARED